MSHWTHINGNVSVRGQKKEVKRVYKEVKDMITGSERNCEITLIHNGIETGSHPRVWMERLPKFLRRKLIRHYYVDERDSYTFCLTGCLRDRISPNTCEEVNRFLSILDAELWVEHVGIVVGDMGFYTVFNDDSVISNDSNDVYTESQAKWIHPFEKAEKDTELYDEVNLN